MKRIILLFSVCLATSVWAGNKNYVSVNLQDLQKTFTLKTKISQPTCKLFNQQKERRGKFLKAKTKGSFIKPTKKEISLLELPAMRELKTLAKSAKTHRLDSIVGTYSNNNEKFSLQTFTYDENCLSLIRINSLWNKATNTWEPIEEYGYEWDEDGYCLRQWGRTFDGNSGMQYAFIYNDKKLGVQQLISNYIGGEWVPSEKGEYTYDDNGFIIDETVSFYDPDAMTWNKVTRNKASWTRLGQQTSFETYSWDGSNWIPADDKVEYAYDANGYNTLYSFNMWKDGAWVNYYRVRQEFKGNLITLQVGEYWNPTENGWVGCYDWKGAVLYNTKTEFSYDEQGKQTDEVAYRINDIEGGWHKTADCDFTYIPLANGGYRQVREMYLLDVSNNVYDELIYEYNKLGQVTYHAEKQDAMKNGNLLFQFEEFYEYAENGDLLKGKTYEFEQNTENLRLAAYAEDYTYDNNHNIIDSYYQQGALYNTGEGGAEEWVNVSRFTYTIEADTVRTEKFAYLWNGTEFVPNWGDAVYFDFEIPVENCILWQDLKPYHKIRETRNYQAAGTEWEYNAFTYYYSNVGTSIDKNEAKKSISVYPIPVTDVLNIRVDGDVKIVIYDVQGTRLLTTQEKRVNMSAFQPGIYIIEVNDVKTKFVKV